MISAWIECRHPLMVVMAQVRMIRPFRQRFCCGARPSGGVVRRGRTPGTPVGSAEAGGWVVIVEKVGFRTRFGIFPSPDPGWSFIGLRSVASDVVDMAGVGARAVVPGKTEPPGLPPRLLWRGRLTDRSTAASARPVQVVSAGPGW